MDFLVQKAYAAVTGSDSPVNNIATDNVVNGSNFNDLLSKILSNIVNPIIYLLMALAVVYFIWGVVVFIQNADKAEKRDEGYKHMIWGVIGIFIMISAKGIINIILSTLGI